MHDKTGKIIYIGKAKALKNRVSQYFGSEKNHDEKVRRMVSNVEYFEYILTDSEFEALVLECSLIKQHTPKYNIPVSYTHLYLILNQNLFNAHSYPLLKQNQNQTIPTNQNLKYNTA